MTVPGRDQFAYRHVVAPGSATGGLLGRLHDVDVAQGGPAGDVGAYRPVMAEPSTTDGR